MNLKQGGLGKNLGPPRLVVGGADMAAIKGLSQVNNMRFINDLVLQWAIIAVALYAAALSGHPGIYVIAFVIIATRQHALGILMHDATHYRCLSSRVGNDIVSDIFCALPINMVTSRYRRDHFLHHKYVNTDKDPYWVQYHADAEFFWPKSKGQLACYFLKVLVGINLLRKVRATANWSPWREHFVGNPKNSSPLTNRERYLIYGFYGFLFVALTITATWDLFLLLWVLPLVTVTPFLSLLRTLGEHFALPSEVGFRTRTTRANFAERIFVSPFNINYHTDHHLFPAVPYYNLPQLHALLKDNEEFKKNALIYDSYFGKGQSLLRDLTANN